MKRYLKLVNFEFNRFAKIYAVLIGFVAVLQVTGLVVMAKGYMKDANEAIHGEGMTQAAYIANAGQVNMLRYVGSDWLFGSIVACIAVVLIYIFMIWYRDWLGKNTFVYRLLMLPAARINVFLAKLTAILLMTFGFVALQLILLPVESTILQWIVPKGFRLDFGVQDIINSSFVLNFIIPNTFAEVVLHYGAGLMAVSVLFTAILFERCYRVKGIVLGVIYAAAAAVLFGSPLLIEEFILKIDYFYALEMLGMLCVTGIIVFTASIWISNYLLNKRIRV